MFVFGNVFVFCSGTKCNPLGTACGLLYGIFGHRSLQYWYVKLYTLRMIYENSVTDRTTLTDKKIETFPCDYESC